MSTKKSKHVLGTIPTPQPMGAELISVFESVALATTDIDNGDVIQMFILPAGCVPVGYDIGVTDMDTGSPALTANFGILNAAGDAISTATADGGAAWIANHAWSGTAALTLHTASKAAYDVLKSVLPSTVDRIVAFVISAGAGTAAAGTVELGLRYKAANV